MDVAISGASGLIGGALARALERDGHRVARLVRPQTRNRAGDTIRWDPNARTIEAEALEGVNAIVHLAGVGIGDKRWTQAPWLAALGPGRLRAALDSIRIAAVTDGIASHR